MDAFMINRSTGIPEEEIEELAGDVGSTTRIEMEDLAAFIEKRLNEMVQR
ncbi:MAG: hypothetical protein R6U36_01350 [Candidatus Fermentibacteraceae bacterium]